MLTGTPPPKKKKGNGRSTEFFRCGTQNTQYYVTRIPCQTCKITLLSEHVLPVRYSPLLLSLDITNPLDTYQKTHMNHTYIHPPKSHLLTSYSFCKGLDTRTLPIYLLQCWVSSWLAQQSYQICLQAFLFEERSFFSLMA